MNHRHLNSSNSYSSVAIDDIIGRGGLVDWAELKSAAQSDPQILARIIKVCASRITDPYEQRYHLWNHYAQHANT